MCPTYVQYAINSVTIVFGVYLSGGGRDVCCEGVKIVAAAAAVRSEEYLCTKRTERVYGIIG